LIFRSRKGLARANTSLPYRKKRNQQQELSQEEKESITKVILKEE
jgi:hypothetical protein